MNYFNCYVLNANPVIDPVVLPEDRSQVSRVTVTNKKDTKKGKSLKSASVGGVEVVSDENAQQSDRTEEEPAVSDGQSVPPVEVEGRARRGFRRVLTSVSGLCKRLSTLILKVVKTIFPWNRRAKRRLAGGGEDEEEL